MPRPSEQPYMSGLARFRALPRAVTAWQPRYRILVDAPTAIHAGPGDWVVIEDDGRGGQLQRVLPDAAFRALYGPADADAAPPALDPPTLAAIREEVAAQAARMDQRPASVGDIATRHHRHGLRED